MTMFPFIKSDHHWVLRVGGIAKRPLRRESVAPKNIYDLARFLLAIRCLPLPTEGLAASIR